MDDLVAALFTNQTYNRSLIGINSIFDQKTKPIIKFDPLGGFTHSKFENFVNCFIAKFNNFSLKKILKSKSG